MNQLEQITDDLSVRLQQAVPNPQAKRGAPLSEQNLQRRLERFYQDAAAVRFNQKLGIVGWARVMLGLRGRLLRAGYPPSMVSPLIRSTLFQSARPAGTSPAVASVPAAAAGVSARDMPDTREEKEEREAQRHGVALEKARALHKAGKRAQAMAAVKGILKRDPAHFEALMLLSVLQAQLGDDEAALATLERAAALQPKSAMVHLAMGDVLLKIGEARRARDSLDASLRLEPGNALAHYKRAMTFMPTLELEAMLASAEEAVRLDPKSSQNLVLRGFALQELHRIDEAVASFQKAEQLEPGMPEALWNLGLARLLRGEFEEGWALYESRRKAHPWDLERQFQAIVEWAGEAELSGKTILLSGEQGFGDQIQFSRYARLVKDRGARVLLHVDGALQALLRHVDGVDDIVPYGVTSLPAIDCWAPMMSLPKVFGTDTGHVPSPGRYLQADPDKVAAWTALLGPRRKPRVGLVWSGSTSHHKDIFRNIALEKMLRHLPQGFDYFGVQKDLRQADREWLPSSGIRFLGSELQDFADTAAVCELMDVVVTIDTSVAHLSAALGRPTWLMLPVVPDWRWMLAGNTSPWYESIRLFRQGKDRDWDKVLGEVAAELKAKFA